MGPSKLPAPLQLIHLSPWLMRLIICSSFPLKMIQPISSLHGQQQQLL
jgi:hypothetical protein